MNSRFLIAAAVISISTCCSFAKTDSQWPVLGGNSQANKISAYIDGGPMTLGFMYALPVTEEKFVGASNIAVGSDTVYLLVDKNSVSRIYNETALDAFDLNGNRRWEVTIPSTTLAQAYHPSISPKGYIYINTQDTPNNFKSVIYVYSQNGELLIPGSCVTNASDQWMAPLFNKEGKLFMLESAGTAAGHHNGLVACDPFDQSEHLNRKNYLWSSVNDSGATVRAQPVIDSKNRLYASIGLNIVAIDTNIDANSGANELWFAPSNFGNRPAGVLSPLIMLSQDERTLFISAVDLKIYALDTTNVGKVLWSIPVSGNPFRQISGAVGVGRLYVANSINRSIMAVEERTGKILWEYNIGNSNELARFVADASNSLYFLSCVLPRDTFPVNTSTLGSNNVNCPNNNYISALSKDGSLRWRYKVKSNFESAQNSDLTMLDDGSLFFAYGENFYKSIPWSLNLDSYNFDSTTKKITFNVASSMLRKDPSSAFDNKVQLYINNTTAVPLTYSNSKDGKTFWKGEYDITSNAGLDVVGQIEAIAFETQTDRITHFNNVPQGFNNSGTIKEFKIDLRQSGVPETNQQKHSSFFKNAIDKIRNFLYSVLY